MAEHPSVGEMRAVLEEHRARFRAEAAKRDLMGPGIRELATSLEGAIGECSVEQALEALDLEIAKRRPAAVVEREPGESEAAAIMRRLMTSVPAATAKPADCTHPDFAAAVAVARLEDSGVISAEVRITCVACHVPMRFLGLPAGWHPERPTSTIDGLELQAPIEPEIEKRLAGGASYTLPRIPVRH